MHAFRFLRVRWVFASLKKKKKNKDPDITLSATLLFWTLTEVLEMG